MDIVLTRAPSNDAWAAHLHQRVAWAKEVHLLDGAAQLGAASARIVLPAGVNAEVVQPDDSLRSVLGVPSPGQGWVKRPDLYVEAAAWLLSQFQNQPEHSLLCEAGLSELGDKSLQGEPHVVFRNRPYYLLSLLHVDYDSLATIMRRSRTWQRFLGVVVETSGNDPGFEFSGGFFLCDVLDGDSLIIVPIQGAAA